MGKKKKNNRNKPKKIEPELSRRSFLRWSVGALAILGGSAALGYSLLDGESPEVNIPNTSNDQWAFLNRKAGISNDELNKIKTSVPIGPASKINIDSKKYDSVRKLILREIERRDLHSTYYVKSFKQRYGQADRPEFTEPLLAYCQKAHDFLYQNIKGLKKFDLEWIALNSKDNYQKDFNQKVFLGNGYCRVLDHYIYDNETDKLIFPHSTSKASNFSNFVRIEYKNKHADEMLWFFICLQTGESALKAPFSEIIPLSLVKKHKKYRKQVGSIEANLAVEAVSEAAGYLLALKLAQELNIPNGARIINRNHQSGVVTNPKYRQVNNAVKWMGKNSIQAGYDLYMEDPAKFMKAIRS